MPQQLLLQGSDLEALLRRARTEYGSTARVVRAEKVRRGGFLGFFTSEHFELTVEVSDAEIARAAGTKARAEIVPSRTTSEEALAAEIADAQAARESMLAGTLGDRASDRGARETTLDDRSAARPVAPPALPHHTSRDSAEFDRLVLSLTEQAESVESPAAQQVTAAQEVTATDLASAPAPFATRAFVPATFPIAERPATIRPATEAADSTIGRTSTALADSAGRGPRALTGDPRVEGGDDPSRRSPSPTRLEGVVLHRWGVFTDVASAVATHCTVPALLALGVPMRCVEDYVELGAPVPLLDVVARFGTPPVRRPEPGDLIVVAGPAEHALTVAKGLAGWVGLSPQAVVLAGDIDAIRGHGRRVRDEAQAHGVRARAEKSAQFGEPTIVALGVTPGRRGAAASAPLLAALDGDIVWAVVDATKRPSAYEPSVRLLAAEGRIDGLAAVNVAEAQAPCAILDASLPVAWMDGLPAAGVVWAALLGERIADVD